MTPKELRYILENNLILLCDKREQQTESLDRRLKSVGLPFQREKLDFGDYSIKCIIDGVEKNFKNKIAIERKMSIDEICNNFCKGRNRFENEFKRAAESGAKMHLIIENGSYQKIIKGEYQSKMNSNSLLSSLISFCDKYDITIHFCNPEETPLLIYKILYFYVKNELTNNNEVKK